MRSGQITAVSPEIRREASRLQLLRDRRLARAETHAVRKLHNMRAEVLTFKNGSPYS